MIIRFPDVLQRLGLNNGKTPKTPQTPPPKAVLPPSGNGISSAKKVAFLIEYFRLLRWELVIDDRFQPRGVPPLLARELRNDDACNQVDRRGCDLEEAYLPQDKVDFLLEMLPFLDDADKCNKWLRTKDKDLVRETTQLLLKKVSPLLKKINSPVYKKMVDFRNLFVTQLVRFYFFNGGLEGLIGRFDDPQEKILAQILICGALVAVAPDHAQRYFEEVLTAVKQTQDSRNVSKSLRNLSYIIKDIIPEAFSSEGSQMVIDWYVQKNNKTEPDHDVISNLGVFYARDKLPNKTNPLVKALLLAGDVLWSHYADRTVYGQKEQKTNLNVLEESMIGLSEPDKRVVLSSARRGFVAGLSQYFGAAFFNRPDNFQTLRFYAATYEALATIYRESTSLHLMASSFTKIVLHCQNDREIGAFFNMAQTIARDINKGYALEKMFDQENDPVAKIRYAVIWLILMREEHDEKLSPGVLQKMADLIQQEGPGHLRQWLANQPEVQQALAVRGKEISLPPLNERITSEEAVLLQRAHDSAGLFFSRNISSEELCDVAKTGEVRGRRKTYWRFGISAEYGKEGETITLVMNRRFWEDFHGRGKFSNLWREDPLNPTPQEEAEKILDRLTKEANYNRAFEVDARPQDGLMGRTVMHEVGFMGYNPQLEVKDAIPLEYVEAVIVPEHLWPETKKAVAGNPRLRELMIKLESGETRDDYLAGRKEVARRRRSGGGGFEPNMGFNALRKLEEAYFQLVVGRHPFQYRRQIVTMSGGRAGWSPLAPDWIQVPADAAKPSLIRNKDGDWKIFVNPREENFFAVLRTVLEVQAEFPEGIDFKVPKDLQTEWREGRPFTASNSPKIVIWVNQATLDQVLERLSARLDAQFPDGIGFGEEPGPSFANPYYGHNLFYKKEYGGDDNLPDPRARIAGAIETQGKSQGLDFAQIRSQQIEALISAGYAPPYFHRKINEPDPAL